MSNIETPAIDQQTAGEMPIISAPLAAKMNFAYDLGQMLRGKNGFLPAPEMFKAEMFEVTGEGYGTKIVLIDDPYVVKKPKDGDDTYTARSIDTIGSLLHDELCTEDERGPVIATFVQSILKLVIANENQKIFEAFTDLHLLGQGLDLRGQRLHPSQSANVQ
jgi:hypothetical protein